MGLVDHDKLQHLLVSSGKFTMGKAQLIIEEMLRAGKDSRSGL
jgi:hypothetical protein